MNASRYPKRKCKGGKDLLGVDVATSIIGVGILIGLAFLIRLFAPKGPDSFPYVTRKSLVSPAERSFLGVLLSAVPEDIVVAPKVRVADVLMCEKGLDRSQWQSAFNRISAKHFDFVLCKASDYSFLAAIELDDASHANKRRHRRDEFLNDAATAADLKLLRIPAKRAYVRNEVREMLLKALNRDIPSATAGRAATGDKAVDQSSRLPPKFPSNLN